MESANPLHRNTNLEIWRLGIFFDHAMTACAVTPDCNVLQAAEEHARLHRELDVAKSQLSAAESKQQRGQQASSVLQGDLLQTQKQVKQLQHGLAESQAEAQELKSRLAVQASGFMFVAQPLAFCDAGSCNLVCSCKAWSLLTLASVQWFSAFITTSQASWTSGNLCMGSACPAGEQGSCVVPGRL